MVGNVTGVSLLETVGAPAPQAGAETAPGQTFATVMQQTSEQSGTPLPARVDGNQPQDSSQKTASVGKGAVASQEAPTKEPVSSGKDPLAALKRQGAAAGTGITEKTNLTALPGRIVTAPQQSLQDENLVAGVADPAGKAPKGTGEATEVKMPVAVMTNGAPAPATVGSPKDSAGKTALQPGTLPQEVAPAVKSTGDKLEAGTRRVDKETPIAGSKQTSKLGDSKVAMTLTALVPQGTPEVPQGFVAAPDLSATNVIVTAPVLVASNAGDADHRATSESLSLLSGTASLVQTVQGPRAQGTQVQAAAPKQGSTVVNAPSTALPVTENIAVKADADQATVPVTDKPIMAAETPLPQVGAQANLGFAAQVQGFQNQQSTVPEPTSTNGTSGVENVTGLASSGTTGIAKPGLQSGRNASGGSKSVTETVASAGIADIKPEAAAAAFSGPQSAPAEQSVQPASGRAAATIAVAKTALKPIGKAAAPAKDLQPLEAPSPGPAKAATPDELVGATAASKDQSDAAVLPVPAQPAVSPVAPVNHAANVTVPAIAAPLPHVPVAAGAAVSDTAGAVSAMRAEAGSSTGGSLPHTTLSATPNSLEVGVSSGTHGWLKIRAELNAAGEVNASLTGANPAAASRLRSELPALSSFLQDEKLSVGTLDVRSALHTAATFENSSTFSQAGMTGSTGTDAGAAGGRAQQQAQQGGENVSVLSNTRDGDEVLLGRISDTATYGHTTELGGGEALSSTGYGAGGSWLNVRV